MTLTDALNANTHVETVPPELTALQETMGMSIADVWHHLTPGNKVYRRSWPTDKYLTADSDRRAIDNYLGGCWVPEHGDVIAKDWFFLAL